MTELIFNEAESIALLQFHLKNQDLESALSLGKRSSEEFPSNISIKFILASIENEIGLDNQAVESYLNCLKIDPNYNLARFQLALIYWKNSKMDEAGNEFQFIVNHKTVNFLTHFSNGFIKLIEKDTPNAIIHFQAGITENVLVPNLNTVIQKYIDSLELNNLTESENIAENDFVTGSINPVQLSKYFS